MTDRERLIELLRSIDIIKTPTENFTEHLADYLLASGVIVPPCKVGDKVWFIRKDKVPDDDYRMSFHDEWVICEVNFQLSMINQIGKTVFLTREEVEKALKERCK